MENILIGGNRGHHTWRGDLEDGDRRFGGDPDEDEKGETRKTVINEKGKWIEASIVGMK
jgi:hypothetical protein